MIANLMMQYQLAKITKQEKVCFVGFLITLKKEYLIYERNNIYNYRNSRTKKQLVGELIDLENLAETEEKCMYYHSKWKGVELFYSFISESKGRTLQEAGDDMPLIEELDRAEQEIKR